VEEESNPRRAGDYTIFQSLHIGDHEVVMGERRDAPKDEQYMCALCEGDGLFTLYSDTMVSGDYPEIVELFGQRVAEQAQKVKAEMNRPKIQGIPNAALKDSDCRSITPDDDLDNKVVVIRSDVLRREYRCATHQIKLCIGGFGASPHSRGSACCCVDLYSGKESRFERRDVLGILEVEQLPEWARLGLVEYQQKQAEKETYHNNKGAR